MEGASSANGLNASFVLGLQIPIFNGYSRQYDVRTAQAQYEAGLARVTSTQQQITVQVFTSYAALQTAGQRLSASADLLTAARTVRRSRHGPLSRGRRNDRRRAARAHRAGLRARRGHTGALGVADGARAAGARRRFARHARPSEHSARAGAEDSMIARRRRVARALAVALACGDRRVPGKPGGPAGVGDTGARHARQAHRRAGHGVGERRRRADADGGGHAASQRHAARRAVQGRRLRAEGAALFRIDPRPLQAVVDQARATLTKDKAQAGGRANATTSATSRSRTSGT